MKRDTPQNLRIPGPTPLPPEVLKSISQQMINHRGHSYEVIQKRVIENLKYFFQTTNDIFLLTSSGMGGLEAAIVNFFSPTDTIVSFTCGEFGNRWADVARAFAANVVQVKFPLGKAVDKDEVFKTLENQPDVKGVLFTLNETATGVLNKIKEFTPFVHQHKNKPLILVDAISGLGAIDLPMDELGIDVLVTASQKAWMAPPGIAMISVSDKAWNFHLNAKMPRYYFDLSMYKKFAEKNQTPATCAVSTIFGLDTALQMMKKEGRENIFKRHLELMRLTRKELRKLGLELFVDDNDASPTVTSIKIPDGVDGHKWLEILREKYNVVLAGGMGETKGKIIRVAHMGWVNRKDLENVIQALRSSLEDLKVKNI